jgi:hypothetical protein
MGKSLSPPPIQNPSYHFHGNRLLPNLTLFMGTTTRVAGLLPDTLGRFCHIVTLRRDSGREAIAGFCIHPFRLGFWE